MTSKLQSFALVIGHLFCLHATAVVAFASTRSITTNRYGTPRLPSNLNRDSINHSRVQKTCSLKHVMYGQPLDGRFSTILRASGSDKDGGWFFKPLNSERSASPNKTSNEGKSPRKISMVKTEVKPKSESGRKRSKSDGEQKQIASKVPSSPLEVLEDGSFVFLALSKPQTIFGIAATAGVSAVAAISYSLGLSPDDFLHGAQTLVTDPQAFLRELIEGVQNLGPTGALYYALVYMIAEILAIPATPLTLSAGYLFGVQQGILTVLAGATGAACIGFWISRIFLRDYVETTLLAPASNPNGEEVNSNTLVKLDKAIGAEGFKLLVLIRLSPIFPFSVVNYLYGASSIDFGPYLLGTLIGFVPTTTAYVYTGMVGQALTVGQGGDQPWYVYAGGFAVLAVLVKLVTDVANGIIEAIEEDT